MRGIETRQYTKNTHRSSTFNYYTFEVNKYNILTPDEEVELTSRIKRGDKAAEELLINSNLKFVISVAKRYNTIAGITLDDIIQYGNIGLIIAARKFDETKGFKFISYAVWWIRQSILQGLQEQRAIRLPIDKFTLVSNILEVIDKTVSTEGYIPTNEQIAEILGVSEDVIIRIVSTDLPRSIDALIGESSTLIEVLEDRDIADTDNIFNKKDMSSIINRTFSRLSPRENDILRMYFGLFPYKYSLTKSSIAEHYNLSEMMISNIIKKGLEKLAKNKEYFRSYL